jgi:hypothetical protein
MNAAILPSESRGNHGNVLLSQIRESIILEDQVPVFVSPKNTVAKLWPSYGPAIHLGTVRFESVTMVTMKNVVFWDIKPQFVPHRRHITSLLKSPAG